MHTFAPYYLKTTGICVCSLHNQNKNNLAYAEVCSQLYLFRCAIIARIVNDLPKCLFAFTHLDCARAGCRMLPLNGLKTILKFCEQYKIVFVESRLQIDYLYTPLGWYMLFCV